MWYTKCTLFLGTSKNASKLDSRSWHPNGWTYVIPWQPLFYKSSQQAFCTGKSLIRAFTLPNDIMLTTRVLVQDWANLCVCPFIQIYPEITTAISQSWQAGKWTDELDLDDLSPMWADWKNSPHHHFYIPQWGDGRGPGCHLQCCCKFSSLIFLIVICGLGDLLIHSFQQHVFTIQICNVKRISPLCLSRNIVDLTAHSEINFSGTSCFLLASSFLTRNLTRRSAIMGTTYPKSISNHRSRAPYVLDPADALVRWCIG